MGACPPVVVRVKNFKSSKFGSVTTGYADADEFIKLVARGLNRYNIIKRENMYTIKEHNYTVNGKKRTQLSE